MPVHDKNADNILASLPKVNWPSGAPDGTWVCGCGEVEIYVKKYGMYHGECYCVNCQVQTKVAQSKQTGDYNRLSPDTGAHWFAQAHTDQFQVVNGYDKIGYYRCAVTAPGECTGTNYMKKYKDNMGEEYKEVIPFHTLYADCCGTKICISNPGHLNQADFSNPWRFKGWKPLQQKDRIVFDVISAPKVGLEWNRQGISSGCLTGDPSTCNCCCNICKGCCCGCCMETCFGGPCSIQRIFGDVCCPCCCKIKVDPKWQSAPMDCKEFCGKSMEYITDPQFLSPKADPPTMQTMSSPAKQQA